MAIGTAAHFKIPDEARGRDKTLVVAKRPVQQDQGGGGDTPDWVPANAKIYIDLVNVRAWTEADGEVAIDTLLGSDANTENGWGPSGYDAGDLTSYGLIRSSNPPALLGGALTKVLAGATVRVGLTQSSGGFNNFSMALLAADGNDAVEVDVNSNTRDVAASSWGGSLSLDIPTIVNKGATGVLDVVAFTVTSVRLDVAANGSDPVTSALDSSDRPSGNPLVAVILDATPELALSTITIYDPLPDTTGLSALSETGVTNTAPTYVGSLSVLGGFNLTDAGSGNRQVFDGNPLVSDVARNSFADAEGNPLTISVVGDARVLIDGDGLFVVNTDATWEVGDIVFSLRATDPGGLYVEQEFTITVTA